MSEPTPQVLRAVTERVVDELTSAAMLFTALDVSNVVKQTLPDARHREISPLVRALFDREGMGAYLQTQIDVMAGGSKPTTAYLYHLPEQPTSMYDDAMRGQLAIRPVSASGSDDDKTVGAATTETKVRVGQDGRARVSRHLLANAGITGDRVLVRSEPGAPRLVLVTGGSASGAAIASLYAVPDLFGTTEVGVPLNFEHPSLLHVPRAMLEIFGLEPKLVARIEGATVVVTRQ